MQVKMLQYCFVLPVLFLYNAKAMGGAIQEEFDYMRLKHPALSGAISIFESGDKHGATLSFLQSIELLKEQNKPGILGLAYAGLGHCYIHSGKSDSALISYHKAFELLLKRDNFMTARVASAIATMYNYKGEYRKAIYYHKYYFDYVRLIDDKSAVAGSYRQMGSYYLNLNQLDTAKIYIDESLKLYTQLKDIKGLTRIKNTLARYYKKIGDISTVISLLLQNNETYSAHPKLFNAGEMLINNSNIAENFITIGQWGKAEEYTKEAYTISSQNKYLIYKAHALAQLGRIKEHTGALDTALVLFNQALNIYRQTKLTVSEIGVLRALGRLSFNQGALSNAEEILLGALAKADSIREPNEKMYLYISLSEVYLEQEQPSKAMQMAFHAEEIARPANNRPALRDIYLNLAKAFEQLNNYKNAVAYQQKAVVIRDSILKDEERKTLYEMEARFQNKKKQEEINRLDLMNELNSVKLRANRRLNRLLLAGLGMLLLVVGFISYLYRRIKAQKVLIDKSLEQKEALLREIHHRVKNNLQIISSLLSLQSRQIDDPKAHEIFTESKNRVKSMALIHQNLYQEEDLIGVDIPKYIDHLANNLVSTYQLGEQLNVITDVDDIKMDVEMIIPIGLILNELITNALKYAYKQTNHAQMRIVFKRKNDNLILSVEDNGSGMPDDFDINNSKGLGFKLVKTFMKKLKGEIRIEKAEGTKIVLSFPNKNAA